MSHSENDSLSIPTQRNDEQTVLSFERSAGPFMTKAINLVYDYVVAHLEKTDPPPATIEPYIVWFSKTLQNWKALVSTNLPDGKYYEVTHNGNLMETYIDVYVRLDNVVIHD